MNSPCDEQLKMIDHFKKFPSMLPYIGINYFASPKKILVIGESHFFDHYPQNENPKINPGATVWYSSTEKDLGEEKRLCIDTRSAVNNSRHHFFTELERIVGQSLGNKSNKALHNIAFMNAFQRPANYRGQSIKELAGEKDFQIGTNTINDVINIIEPNFVIFVSKYSWDNIGKRLDKRENTIYDYTVHPAAFGKWNDLENPNSKYKFLELLKNQSNNIYSMAK